MGSKVLRDIAKIRNAASASMPGRTAVGTGPLRDLTASEVRSLLSVSTTAEDAALYVSLLGSYTNPSWIVSIPNTKVTGLGTLSTQNGTLSDYLTSATAATTYASIAAGQPTSGTVGQVLAKNSGTNYDSSWTSLVLGDRYLSTSTTSNTLSNTVKSFTIATGLAYTPTQNITIAYDADHHMHGEVVTYNSGTGALSVDVKNHTGAGTYTSWVVNVGGVTPATVVSWGDIIGTLGTQSDLSTALNAKLEITTAASTYLPLAGGTLTGDLKFTDATYDIGKTGATRPRDGFFSRNLSVGNTLTLSGTYAYYNPAIVLSGGGGISVQSVLPFYFSNTEYCRIYNGQFQTIGNFGIGAAADSPDVIINRDAAGIFAQRNGTNAQTLRVYNTYTSSTSFENLQFKANAGSAYQIGSAVGSAGGTNRDLTFGHYDSAGTFTVGLTINTAGHLVSSYTARLGSDGLLVNGAGYVIGFNATVFGWTSGSYIGSNSTPEFGWYREAINHARLKTPAGVNGTLTIGSEILTQPVSTSGSPTAFTITGAAHTTLTTAEVTDGYFNAYRTVNFGATGGTIANQRTWRFTAPTFTATAATTLTRAATVSITGAPVASTGVTASKSCALHIENGGLVVSGSDNESNRISIMSSPTFFGTRINSQSLVFSEASNGGYMANSGQNSDYGNLYFGYGTTVGSNVMAGLRASGWCFIGASIPVWFGSSSVVGPTGVAIYAPSNGVWEQRNSTNAQTFRVAGTWTSTTAYELINIKGKASANFEIGPENGSAGGTLRGLTLGGYTAGSATITPWLSFTSSGNASFSQYATIQGGVLVEAGGSYTTSYASPAQVRVRRAQGTQASPTQVTTGVQLGIIGAQGLNNAGAYAGYTSYISFNAGENITTTGCGGYFNFYTTPVGSLTEVMRTWIGAAGNFGIGVFAAEPSTLLTINGDMLRLMVSKTPATSGAAGNAGEICWDTTYLYGCTATNTWKRIAWTTF